MKKIAPGVSKATVKTVIRECEECQSIYPAPVHWSKGALNVKQTWHRVVMDINHCNGAHFLTVIDDLAMSSLTRCDKCNQPAEGVLL